MDVSCYIHSELFVLIPVMYFIGLALKKSKVKDRWIPLMLGAVSVALCVIWVLSTSPIHSGAELFSAIFTALTQGVLIAGASVYANQIFKQTKN